MACALLLRAACRYGSARHRGDWTYRRVEHITLWSPFQLSFFAVAATARPGIPRVTHEMMDMPLGAAGFWFLGAAIIGACFNPWMMFYQQSAVVDKRLGLRDYRLARAETAVGAVVAQLLTASVLFAAATTFGPLGFDGKLETIGDIGVAMKPLFGPSLGPLVLASACSAPRWSLRWYARSRWRGASASFGAAPVIGKRAASSALVLPDLRRRRYRCRRPGPDESKSALANILRRGCQRLHAATGGGVP